MANEHRGILTDIRQGKIAPVYILMGEEPYYIDLIVDLLADKVVAEEERDFNSTILYGNETDILSITSACQQYPFMADRRIVIVKEAQTLSRAKEALNKLADYLLHPSEKTVLVIAFKGEMLNATSAIMKAAGKNDRIVVFRSPKLRDYQLDTPIKEYLTAKRIGIDEKALAMIKESIGTDLSKIFGEIDKLIVASGGKLPKITPEIVERNIGISKDFNNYELQEALANKNYDKCLLIIKYFARNPKNNPTNLTTGTLYTFFSRLAVAVYTKDRSDASLMAALEIQKPGLLRDYKTALSRYSPSQALKAIRLLRDFDCKSKGIGSLQKEYDLLLELIYNIFISR